MNEARTASTEAAYVTSSLSARFWELVELSRTDREIFVQTVNRQDRRGDGKRRRRRRRVGGDRHQDDQTGIGESR